MSQPLQRLSARVVHGVSHLAYKQKLLAADAIMIAKNMSLTKTQIHFRPK